MLDITYKHIEFVIFRIPIC